VSNSAHWVNFSITSPQTRTRFSDAPTYLNIVWEIWCVRNYIYYYNYIQQTLDLRVDPQGGWSVDTFLVGGGVVWCSSQFYWMCISSSSQTVIQHVLATVQIQKKKIGLVKIASTIEVSLRGRNQRHEDEAVGFNHEDCSRMFCLRGLISFNFTD